ncbi:MAG: hypothetical protein OXC10_03825 [Rhodospirillaceae bacterium]|nr:hypothetical protein [Rhodospirillaceae bacterium]
MRIDGRCHCGNLGFELETALSWETIRPRECDCSFCRAHAARCVSDPNGRATVFVADPERLVRYRFGLRTAEFLVCKSCGVYVGAFAEDEAGGFATLNLRATAHHGRSGAATSYGLETAESRRARRRERWTPAELRLGSPPPAAAAQT